MVADKGNLFEIILRHEFRDSVTSLYGIIKNKIEKNHFPNFCPSKNNIEIDKNGFIGLPKK